MTVHNKECPDCGKNTLSIYDTGTYCHHPECHVTTGSTDNIGALHKEVLMTDVIGTVTTYPVARGIINRGINPDTTAKYGVRVEVDTSNGVPS